MKTKALKFINELLRKMKSTKTKVIEIFEKRRLTAGVLCIVFMAVMAIGSISGMKLTFAKEVFVEGKSVGIVKDSETYENVVKEVETELTESGLNSNVKTETKYVLRVVTEDEITSEPDLKQGVMANCDDTIHACSVYYNEKLVFSAMDNLE